MQVARLRAGTLIAILIGAGLHGFAASLEGRRAVVGTIKGSGTFWVDGLRVPAETALFVGDVITTDKAAGAVVSFLRGTTASVDEESGITILASPSVPTLDLQQGTLVIRSTGLAQTQVNVLGASVLAEGRAEFSAVCKVASVGHFAAVFAESGRMVIHGAGAPRILNSGEFALLARGMPQVGGQISGRIAGLVTKLVPEEVVEHQGERVEVTLRSGEIVNWGDTVRTLETGRVRIRLLGGSLLNLGARSSMKITRSDPQSQQTQIEFALGHLRAEVVKPTEAGSSFQVRTTTAIIGGVGAVILIGAFPRRTGVCDMEGVVSVRNVDTAIPGEVVLHAGECTSVALGQTPIEPEPGSARIQKEMALTRPEGLPTAEQITFATQVRKATAGANAAAAVLSGLEIFQIGGATDALQAAKSKLKQADVQLEAALSAAQAADKTARNIRDALQRTAQRLEAAVSAAKAAEKTARNFRAALLEASQRLVVSPSAPESGFP